MVLMKAQYSKVLVASRASKYYDQILCFFESTDPHIIQVLTNIMADLEPNRLFQRRTIPLKCHNS